MEAERSLNELVAFGDAPVVRFEPEATHCPLCGDRLKVYKTTEPREVVTLRHGVFRVVEQMRYCAGHVRDAGASSDASAPGRAGRAGGRRRGIYGSDQLRSIAGPGRKYGYDLMAHVGQRYFLDCRNEAEIAAELAERACPVPVSPRSLHRLLDEFVWFVAAVHEAAVPRLRELFRDNGGYVLCVDGTCEGGSPVHLACRDSVTGIVVAAFKIGSENEAEATRSLQRVQALFDDPVATMSDMSRPLRAAQDAVWPDRRHFVCHYHFVQDVGRDLLKPYHERVDALFRKSKLTSALIEMRRYLGKRVRVSLDQAPLRLDQLMAQAERGDTEGLARAIESLRGAEADSAPRATRSASLEQLDREELSLAILWIQAYRSDGRGQGFPFDLPKLAYWRRCACVRRHLAQWLAHAHPGSRQGHHFEKLHRLLSGVVDDAAFRDAAADLERAQADFLQLRSVLRILPAAGAGGVVHDDAFASLADAQACERRADALRRDLRRRLEPGSAAAPLDKRSAKIIVAHLDAYWSSLFGHAFVTDNGGLLLVDRTNNGQERDHRFSKRARRRIHGRRSVKHDLTRWPAERALVYNLRNPLYVRAVYGDLSSMPGLFADVFGRVAAVREAARPAEATVRLSRRRRKSPDALNHVTAIRRLLAKP